MNLHHIYSALHELMKSVPPEMSWLPLTCFHVKPLTEKTYFTEQQEEFLSSITTEMAQLLVPIGAYFREKV